MKIFLCRKENVQNLNKAENRSMCVPWLQFWLICLETDSFYPCIHCIGNSSFCFP